MAKEEAAAEEDIVASGEALRTVASWLGVADVDDVMEKEGLNPEFEMGRQQGLGLGAKYLPHHKAVALTSGLEQRLGSKIRRSVERRLAEEVQSEQHAGPASRRGFATQQTGRWLGDKMAGKKQRQQQQVQQAAAAGGQDSKPGREDGSEDDSSEEEGRGSAFGKGKHAAHKRMAFSRSDLLKADVAANGKKRKRNGGKAQPATDT